jgi:excisionase family DNA binding protein
MYRISDAVRALRLSRSVIYEQIKEGRLRTVKQGRATLITAAALDAYVKLLEREEAERNENQ